MATYDFSGKYFLVSGATAAIGSQLCRELKKSNARFFVCGRDSVKLENLKTELQCEGAMIDGASFSSYEDAVSKALIHGNLSGAVCCTGSVILKSAHSTSQQEFDATMSANATSAFGLTRAAAKAMTNSGGGSIILVASAAAQIGLQNHEAIAAAKGAVMGLALSAAATYARSQIRVNCVSPGLTETPLTSRITANEASRKASEALHPLGRLGEPEDIVAAPSLDEHSDKMKGKNSNKGIGIFSVIQA